MEAQGYLLLHTDNLVVNLASMRLYLKINKYEDKSRVWWHML